MTDPSERNVEFKHEQTIRLKTIEGADSCRTELNCVNETKGVPRGGFDKYYRTRAGRNEELQGVLNLFSKDFFVSGLEGSGRTTTAADAYISRIRGPLILLLLPTKYVVFSLTCLHCFSTRRLSLRFDRVRLLQHLQICPSQRASNRPECRVRPKTLKSQEKLRSEETKPCTNTARRRSLRLVSSSFQSFKHNITYESVARTEHAQVFLPFSVDQSSK